MKTKKAYNLLAAINMLENKKGAGVSKKTRVLINIQMKEGIIKTQVNLKILKATLDALGVSYQSKVTTEMENNPDWEDKK